MTGAKVQSLRPPDPAPVTRSVEREKLAQAIERHRAATERLGKIRAAASAAGETLTRKAVAEAEAALAEARADEPRQLVARMLNEADDALTVAAATEALAAATAARDLTDRTRAALREREAAAVTDLSWATAARENAIKAIVAPSASVAQLLADHHVARRRTAELAAALGFLGWRWLPPEAQHWAAIPVPNRAAEAAAVAPWAAALSALESDPDTLLPGDAPPAPAAA